MKQLGLFGGGVDDDQPHSEETTIDVHVTDRDRELAARLPRFVRLGTSSWSFPGWKGLFWKGAPSESALAKSGLEAYARHPLFRTVGLDRTYYGPLRDEEVASYARQIERAAARAPELPPFKMIAKVWDEITTAVFPKHPRYGARAGAKNPRFLDADVLAREVLAPYGDRSQTFLVELTPMPHGALDERTLIAKVDGFLARLPTSQHRWAFELRNAELFGPRWLDMLASNGVANVFNYWTAMPPLRDQLRVARQAQRSKARAVVVRLMLPPFTRYAHRKVDFAPFDKIVEPQPEMRAEVIDILRAAEAADVDDAFVIVNNKAEGSSPETVRALAAGYF